VRKTPRRLGIWKIRVPVVMDRVGAPAAEAEPLEPGEPCPNCGDRTGGNYCRHCGQARRVVHVSLREMLTDFLDDQLALNSKLPVTVAFLLLRPGFLTREYLRGRIASYIRPLRLYVGTSVLFFVVFAFLAQREGWMLHDTGPANGRAAGDSLTTAVADSVQKALDQARRSGAPIPPVPPGLHARQLSRRTAHADSARQAAARSQNRFEGMGELGDTLNAKLVRWEKMDNAQRQRVILDGLQEQGPRLMFVMLPIFAFILKLLYVRSKRYYVEHFVFSLHFHAFAFLLFTIYLGLEEIPGMDDSAVGPLLWAWTFVYLYIAMKKVYGQGLMMTGVKYWTLFWSYFCTLVTGFLVTAAAIFYFT
jgi:hypothetical protein